MFFPSLAHDGQHRLNVMLKLLADSVKNDQFFGVGTGMGLRKDDAELKAALDKAFAEMRKDGTYDKLAKKYFDFDVYGG